LGDELHAHAGGAGDLAALAGTQLDVVHRGAHRDVAHRERATRLDVGALTALHAVADLQTTGGEDVGLHAVGVVQQGDAAGAVRVVLDGGDLRRHAVLDALEVDDAVLALVAATAVARRDATVGVAAGLLRLRRDERALRGRLGDLGEVGDRLGAADCACGLRTAGGP